MKKKYVIPALDIIEFDITDIITHSNASGTGSDGGIILPGDDDIFDPDGDFWG